jgi:hypothetical protein
MKIENIGGSNSIISYSYTHKLKNNKNFKFDNYGIGATNSIYGLIQIIKYDLINNYDLIIYEYFVNDNNHYLQNINNVDRVNKTLIEINNMCSNSNTKLLFIYIYNKEHKNNNIYLNSDMYHLYISFQKKYNITTIDVYDLLYSKFNKNWANYYRDPTHLSDTGMNILYNEILEKIKISQVPTFINNNNSYNTLNLIQISKYADTINFSNSLININYLTITDNIEIKFNKKTTILAIEYVCDNNSGYIEISNNKSTIQKNSLKNDSFVRIRNKKMASLITFNSYILEESDYISIKIISYHNIDFNIYDRERITFEKKTNNNTNFKLISLLVSNNADIINIIK